MSMRTVWVVLLLLLSFAVGLSQTPVREGFNYPLTTLAGLGTASNGFGGPWVKDESNGVDGLVTIAGTRFNYGDLSWALPHDTTHLQVVKSNAWADHIRFKRPLAAAWPNTQGNKYWLTYMLDVKDSLPVGNTYFMVKLYSSNTEILALGKGGGATTPVWTCGSGWPGSSGDDLSTVPITAGPFWIVMRIDMSGNGTDPCRTYMWLDPNPAVEPDTGTAIVKRNSTVPAAGIDNIALEFGGDGILQRLVFDEIRMAPSYAGLSTALSVPDGENLPMTFGLAQNYPNPFNPSTKISYTLDRTGQVWLSVYDLLGREVAVLVNGVQNVGPHEIDFHASGLTSGAYFYRLQTSQGAVTKKMLLMK